MVLSVEEWRRRILEYFCAGRHNISFELLGKKKFSHRLEAILITI